MKKEELDDREFTPEEIKKWLKQARPITQARRPRRGSVLTVPACPSLSLEARAVAALRATTHDDECHPSEGKHSARCLRVKALIDEAEKAERNG
jgi:hypothetical protein